MAASITANYPVVVSASSPVDVCPQVNRRRRISPQAGHALEILGHAIDYLTDEYINEQGMSSPLSGHSEAVQLLMAINREIYFQCPVVPTFKERFRELIRFRRK